MPSESTLKIEPKVCRATKGFKYQKPETRFNILECGDNMGNLSDHQDTEHFSYSRTWDEIESMLRRAESKQNYWINEFHMARSLRDRERMKDAARNKKALEGVIKTLRWTLGDKNVAHPLE